MLLVPEKGTALTEGVGTYPRHVLKEQIERHNGGLNEEFSFVPSVHRSKELVKQSAMECILSGSGETQRLHDWSFVEFCSALGSLVLALTPVPRCVYSVGP